MPAWIETIQVGNKALMLVAAGNKYDPVVTGTSDVPFMPQGEGDLQLE